MTSLIDNGAAGPKSSARDPDQHMLFAAITPPSGRFHCVRSIAILSRNAPTVSTTELPAGHLCVMSASMRGYNERARFATPRPLPAVHFTNVRKVRQAQIHENAHLNFPARTLVTKPTMEALAVPCRWGAHPCGILLDDVTASGIARHLKDHHYNVGGWHNRYRGPCLWRGADGACCNRDMFYGTFGKHTATVHLQTLKRTCRLCHATFSRGDALRRHLDAYCPKT